MRAQQMTESEVKLKQQIDKLENRIEELEKEKTQRENNWRDKQQALVDDFERKYLVGSELDISPGAAAVVSKNAKNTMIAFFTLATISVGVLGWNASNYFDLTRDYVDKITSDFETRSQAKLDDIESKAEYTLEQITSQVDAKVGIAVDESVEKATTKIETPVVTAYTKAMDNIFDALEKNRKASDKQLREFNDKISTNQNEVDEVRAKLDTAYRDSITAAETWVENLQAEISVNPDLINNLRAAVFESSQWTKLEKGADPFDWQCQYMIKISDPQHTELPERWYPAAFVEKERLTFYFSNSKWDRVNTHYVERKDLDTYQWAGGNPDARYKGEVWAKCETATEL